MAGEQIWQRVNRSEKWVSKAAENNWDEQISICLHICSGCSHAHIQIYSCFLDKAIWGRWELCHYAKWFRALCPIKSLPAIGMRGVKSSTWLWEVVGASLQNPSEGFYPGAIGPIHIYRRLVQGQSPAIKCCFMFFFQAEEPPYKLYITYLVPPSCTCPSPFALGFLRPSPDFLQAWVDFIDWSFSCS